MELDFFTACENGDLSKVKELINNANIDINWQTKWGSTFLSVACESEHYEIIKLLLTDDRIDVTKMNCENETPLSTACYRGRIKTIKILIASGRNFDGKIYQKSTRNN